MVASGRGGSLPLIVFATYEITGSEIKVYQPCDEIRHLADDNAGCSGPCSHAISLATEPARVVADTRNYYGHNSGRREASSCLGEYRVQRP